MRSVYYFAAGAAGFDGHTNQGFGSLVQFDFWGASPLAWVALLTLAIYWFAATALWSAGKRWSVRSSVSFTLGCLMWFAVTGLSLNSYAGELVSVLLFQQITLIVIAPPLLLMGSPGRLLLRATPHRGLGAVVLRAALAGYRSRVSYYLLHPAVAVLVTVLAFPALYLSDAISWTLGLPAGHLVLLSLFLVCGIIAAAPLWSLDQLPRRPSYVARIIGLVVEVQIHAVFGLVLIMNAEALFSWFAREPLGWRITRSLDQTIGGGLMWTYGELPLLIMMLVTLSKWRSREMRTAKQREPQEDAELEAYNAYLSQMQGKS